MAKRKELPAFSKKRKILYSDKISDRQRLETGIEFMEAGLYYDALEFFVRSGDERQVSEIAEIGMRRCDVPLFLRAKVILKEEPEKKQLLEMAERAVGEDLPLMAALAYEKASMHDKAEEIRAGLYGSQNPASEETED